MATTDTTSTELTFTSHGITDVGNVRDHNEDAFLERPEIGLWVVADGMGGHDSGDMASKMIIDDLKKIHHGLKLNRIVDAIEEKLINVNRKLLDKSNCSKRKSTIGSTAMVMLAYKNYCVYLWVGDSRLYRLHDNTLQQLSRDHSQVQIYLEYGLINEEQAAIHPHRNMITRAVGAMEELHVDIDIQMLGKQDRYLLCSDGLNRHLSDSEIENTLRDGGCVKKTCNALIDKVLERGAEDNVTAIVIDVS